MSRTFGPAQVALVKATSFVSEAAPLLIAPGATALFLYATPANYIASILAGENSLKELAVLHSNRLERLRNRGIELAGFDRSDAHRAALAWACELTSLEASAEAMHDRRILWADFDRMLGDMGGCDRALCRRLRLCRHQTQDRRNCRWAFDAPLFQGAGI